MFLFLGKILANVSKCKNASLKRFECVFDWLGTSCSMRHVESKFGDNWHSINEWIAGYRAGCYLAKAEPDLRFIEGIKFLPLPDGIGKEVAEV